MVDRWNRVPDGIEPIVAYRGWHYGIGHGRAALRSLTDSGLRWEGASRGWVTASCNRQDAGPWHFAPEEQCTCGFYAVKALPHVLRWVPMLQGIIPPSQPSTSNEARNGVVFGRVELAGKVVEHELGYRAERARIAELIPIRGSEWPVMILGQRLGIPVAEPVDVPTPDEFFAQVFVQQVSARPVPRMEPKTPPRGRDWNPLRVAGICLLGVVLLFASHTASPTGEWPVGHALVWTTILLALYS